MNLSKNMSMNLFEWKKKRVEKRNQLWQYTLLIRADVSRKAASPRLYLRQSLRAPAIQDEFKPALAARDMSVKFN
jgi:cation diffusion facilitator CzcD-associated flavoprotein CzcO